MDYDSGLPNRSVLMERSMIDTKLTVSLSQSLGVQGKGVQPEGTGSTGRGGVRCF